MAAGTEQSRPRTGRWHKHMSGDVGRRPASGTRHGLRLLHKGCMSPGLARGHLGSLQRPSLSKSQMLSSSWDAPGSERSGHLPVSHSQGQSLLNRTLRSGPAGLCSLRTACGLCFPARPGRGPPRGQHSPVCLAGHRRHGWGWEGRAGHCWHPRAMAQHPRAVSPPEDGAFPGVQSMQHGQERAVDVRARELAPRAKYSWGSGHSAHPSPEAGPRVWPGQGPTCHQCEAGSQLGL